MTGQHDRRLHRRLALRMAVLCHKVGTAGHRPYTGNTVNISPGGALMEIDAMGLVPGQLLRVEIAVPPTEGLLDQGGRFTTHATVVRVEPAPSEVGGSRLSTQHVAMQFCSSPHLAM